MKLKPCPFCGDTAVVLHLADDTWEVKCEDGCEARNYNWVSEEAAIKAWNNRPGEKAARIAMLNYIEGKLDELEGINVTIEEGASEGYYISQIDIEETFNDLTKAEK